jgi:hypothetical protein
MTGPQMKMENLRPLRCCMNDECRVAFFKSATSLLCPGCGELSDYFVDKITYKVRYDGTGKRR